MNARGEGGQGGAPSSGKEKRLAGSSSHLTSQKLSLIGLASESRWGSHIDLLNLPGPVRYRVLVHCPLTKRDGVVVTKEAGPIVAYR